MSSESKIKLLSLGGGAVGKTSLSTKWIKNEFYENYTPTIEEMFEKSVEVQGRTYEVEITDTAGQDEFSAMKFRYISPSEGFIFVFSILEKKTYNELTSLYNEVIETKNRHYVPCVVIGNKGDLRNESSIDNKRGEELAQRFKSQYFETSALNGTNVSEAFMYVIRQVINSRKGEGSCCQIQ